MWPAFASGLENLLVWPIGLSQSTCGFPSTGTGLYARSLDPSQGPSGHQVIHMSAEPLAVAFEVTIGEPDPNPKKSGLVAASESAGRPVFSLTPYLKKRRWSLLPPASPAGATEGM